MGPHFVHPKLPDRRDGHVSRCLSSPDDCTFRRPGAAFGDEARGVWRVDRWLGMEPSSPGGISNFRDDFSSSPEDFFLKGGLLPQLVGDLGRNFPEVFFFCSRTESCGWFPHLKNIRSIAALVVLNLEKPRKFLSHFSLGFTGRFDPDSSGAQRFMEEQRKFNPKPTRKQFEAGGNIRRFTEIYP